MDKLFIILMMALNYDAESKYCHYLIIQESDIELVELRARYLIKELCPPEEGWSNHYLKVDEIGRYFDIFQLKDIHKILPNR